MTNEQISKISAFSDKISELNNEVEALRKENKALITFCRINLCENCKNLWHNKSIRKSSTSSEIEKYVNPFIKNENDVQDFDEETEYVNTLKKALEFSQIRSMEDEDNNDENLNSRILKNNKKLPKRSLLFNRNFFGSTVEKLENTCNEENNDDNEHFINNNENHVNNRFGSLISLESVKSSDDCSHDTYKQFLLPKWKNIQNLMVRYAINFFNREHNNGADFIFQSFANNSDAIFIKILKECQFLSRKSIGEFLGDTRKSFNIRIMENFVKTFDFTESNLEHSIRNFQSTFRMPGEAQKISHIFETFSRHFLICNSNVPTTAYHFETVDDVLLLAYAIVMLNTDLHSVYVKNKMTLEQFIRNIKRSGQLLSIPDEYLTIIYNNIKEKEFTTNSDNISQLRQIVKGIHKLESVDLIQCFRQFVGMYQVTCSLESLVGYRSSSRLLFLFNDLIVITKMTNKNTTIIYNYEKSVTLESSELKEILMFDGKKGVVLIKNGKKAITIEISNQTSDKRLVIDLKTCIKESNYSKVRSSVT